jgi:hypothetical protein
VVTLVFVGVVVLRVLVPLLIPRFPLPAIIASLVIDAVDQTIFQAFGYDPPGYQGYDKAMDVYYLAIAYLATLRNWTNLPAVRVARFLYFYRLIGVVAFELTGWRTLLLIFPNTFEYFFIAYEVYRLFWNPARVALRSWVVTAATIWVFVKLPQEWWIHIAQLDFTETLAEVPWFGPLCVAGLTLIGSVYWFVVRPRQPAHDWSWHVAADPLPDGAVTVADRNRWVAGHGRLWSAGTLEKVTLIGLLWVIYAQVLPDTGVTPMRLFLGTTVFVLINTAIALTVARSGHAVEPTLVAFGLRVLVNLGLAGWLLPGEVNAGAFVLLLSLLSLLDDRYRPIHEIRFRTAG